MVIVREMKQVTEQAVIRRDIELHCTDHIILVPERLIMLTSIRTCAEPSCVLMSGTRFTVCHWNSSCDPKTVIQSVHVRRKTTTTSLVAYFFISFHHAWFLGWQRCVGHSRVRIVGDLGPANDYWVQQPSKQTKQHWYHPWCSPAFRHSCV